MKKKHSGFTVCVCVLGLEIQLNRDAVADDEVTPQQ